MKSIEELIAEQASNNREPGKYNFPKSEFNAKELYIKFGTIRDKSPLDGKIVVLIGYGSLGEEIMPDHIANHLIKIKSSIEAGHIKPELTSYLIQCLNYQPIPTSNIQTIPFVDIPNKKK